MERTIEVPVVLVNAFVAMANQLNKIMKNDIVAQK